MDHQTAAIILCAGLGSRFGQTREQNKCAVGVQDTSPVAYGVSALLGAGADVVIVVTGYAPDSVKEALSDYRGDSRVVLAHNPWYDKHGCNYSLSCGMEAVDNVAEADRVVIAEGDSLLHRESFLQLCQQKAEAASLVREKSYVDEKRSVVAVGHDQKILRYEYDVSHKGEIHICKEKEEILGESMQLWSFSKGALAVLREELKSYKRMAEEGQEAMLHSGVYSINRIGAEIEPVYSRRPEDWINLNTQQDLRKAGLTEWIRK